MRITTLLILVLAVSISCNQGKKTVDTTERVNQKNVDSSKETASFFPVGDFIKGELTEIRRNGKNPIKYFFRGKQQDSSWIKVEALETEFQEFYSPLIDSISYASFFSEKKFFDETLSAVTLVYDPINILPETLPWINWDFYIDPETNSVNRIYLVKKLSPDQSRQFTWIPGKSCRAITIVESNKGEKPQIIDEVNIKWDY